MLEEEEEIERHLKIIESHIAQLSEHFETVQIFVTKVLSETDETLSYGVGAGNWYARYGQTVDWLVTQDERTKLKLKRSQD